MKNKTVKLIFFSLIALGMFFFSYRASCTAFSGKGAGTSANPYVITTCGQLQEVDNARTSYYKLGNDFTCSGNFTPIRTFTGNLNGDGYKVADLTINGMTGKRALFEDIGAAGVVKNIGLENASISGGMSVGGITVENSGRIEKSYITGIVSGTANVGGLVETNNGTIFQCYSTANVNTSGVGTTGGLVAVNDGTIEQSYAMGNVAGGISGGLVGTNQNATILNSYATGSVTGSVAGGLIGQVQSGTVSNSYATGLAGGGMASGGLTGTCTSGVTNSFWNKDINGSSSCGTDKTTIQMRQRSTFEGAGWDFAAIWSIADGSDYPCLSWDPSCLPSLPTCSNWEMVDDITADGDATYIYNNTTVQEKDVYNITNPPAGTAGTINKVKIKTVYAGDLHLYLRLPGKGETTYPASPTCQSVTQPGSIVHYCPYSADLTPNKPGGGAWTWADINNLQVGVGIAGWDVYPGKITQVYIEVDYGSPSTILILRPNGSGDYENIGGKSCLGSFSTTSNVWGWAWSENIGWTSFSCENDNDGNDLNGRESNVCATSNYGVNINPVTGVFSGYAWSENMGWLSFNQSDLSPTHPVGTVDLITGEVSGWARFLGSNAVKFEYSDAVGIATNLNSGTWLSQAFTIGTASSGGTTGVGENVNYRLVKAQTRIPSSGIAGLSVEIWSTENDTSKPVGLVSGCISSSGVVDWNTGVYFSNCNLRENTRYALVVKNSGGASTSWEGNSSCPLAYPGGRAYSTTDGGTTWAPSSGCPATIRSFALWGEPEGKETWVNLRDTSPVNYGVIVGDTFGKRGYNAFDGWGWGVFGNAIDSKEALIGWINFRGSEHWTLVDDVNADDDGTYVQNSTDEWQDDYYQLENPVVPPGNPPPAIDSFTVYARGQGQIQVGIYHPLMNSNVQTVGENLNCAWAGDNLVEWPYENPIVMEVGKLALGWNDINDLQVRVLLTRNFTSCTLPVKLTQIYVVVNYAGGSLILRPNGPGLKTNIEGESYSYSVRTSVPINGNPPLASISCEYPLGTVINPCEVYQGEALILRNKSTDLNSTNPPDNNNDIKQSQWWTKLKADPLASYTSFGPCGDPWCNYTPSLGLGSYTAKLKVTDSKSNFDEAEQDFKIKRDIAVDFECKLGATGSWISCSDPTLVPVPGDLIFVRDTSVPSEGSSISSRAWSRDSAVIPAFANNPNPADGLAFAPTQITLKLDVTDSNSRSGSRSYTINGKMPLPTWTEIKP